MSIGFFLKCYKHFGVKWNRVKKVRETPRDKANSVQIDRICTFNKCCPPRVFTACEEEMKSSLSFTLNGAGMLNVARSVQQILTIGRPNFQSGSRGHR